MFVIIWCWPSLCYDDPQSQTSTLNLPASGSLGSAALPQNLWSPITQQLLPMTFLIKARIGCSDVTPMLFHLDLRFWALSVARFSSPAGMFSDGAAVLWRENLNEDANNKSATSFNALIYFKFLSLPWQFHSHFKATRWLRRFMIIMFIISCQHIAPGIVT